MLHNRERLLNVMEENNVDYLISSSPENFMYLAEFYSINHWQIKGTNAFVIYPKDKNKEPIMVIPQSDLDNLAVQGSWIEKFESFGTCIIEEIGNPNLTEADKRYKHLRSIANGHPNAFEALLSALSRIGFASNEKIAFDERSVAFTFIRELEEKLGTKIIPGTALFQKIRLVKTLEEVRRLERAVSITQESVCATLDRTEMGMTEKQMLCIYNEEIAKRCALPAMNCLGLGGRSAYANVQVTSDTVIKRDQLIRFDIGCIYEFYHADTALNAVFGKLSDRHYEYFDAIKEAIDKAIKIMKPGLIASEVYHIAMNDVKKTIPQISRPHVGHGIGIEVYDPPMITAASDFKIEAGMVFCIEIPYYEYEFGGLQVEEVVHITENGAEVLSRRPVEIIHR